MTQLQRSWDRRLDNARRRGYFNHDDFNLALGWATCAVGERGHAGTMDDELVKLGCKFTGAIGEDAPYNPKARQIYSKIIRRTKELDKEIA